MKRRSPTLILAGISHTLEKKNKIHWGIIDNDIEKDDTDHSLLQNSLSQTPFRRNLIPFKKLKVLVTAIQTKPLNWYSTIYLISTVYSFLSCTVIIIINNNNNTLFVLINVNIDTMNRRYQRLSLSRVSPF